MWRVNRKKEAIIRQRGEGKTVSLGPNRVTFLVSGEMTGERYSLTEFEVAPPPAPAPPIHIHKAEDEAMYVLEGEFKFVIGEQTLLPPTGSFVLVRRGTPHTASNLGPGTGRLLIILTPPGFEKYWEEMANLLMVSGGQPDPAAVLSLQEKYNMDAMGQARRFTNP